MSGTSMAAPHVAGAAALLSAYDPGLSAASLKATLMNTVDVLPGWSATPVKTGGRINVANALQNRTTCTFSLQGNSVGVPLKGGILNVNVTAPANCDFVAREHVGWLYVLDTDSFSGNSTVKIRVSTSMTLNRSATVLIGGQVFTVTQARF